MGQEPTTVNRTLGVVETVLNAAVMKVGAPAVVKLIQSLPGCQFLTFWPLSAILEWAVNFVLRYLSVFFQVAGVKLVLTIQTDAEVSKYVEAEGKLREALLSGDPDAIKKRSEEFDKAADSLIHWDGSATVIR